MGSLENLKSLNRHKRLKRLRTLNYLMDWLRYNISTRSTIIIGVLLLLFFGFFLPFRAGKANNPNGNNSLKNLASAQVSNPASDNDLHRSTVLPAQTQTQSRTQTQKKTQAQTIAPTPEHSSKIKADFSNAIFVGDSITFGFKNSHNTPVKQDHVYAKIGAHVYEGIGLLGDNSDLIKSRCNGSVDYVFLMFGANDYGYDAKSYKQWYKELVEHSKKMFPDAKIILQSVMPMKSTPEQPQRNLEPEKMNRVVKTVAADENVKYLDVSQSIANAKSLLLADGLHFKPELYPLWISVIKANEKQLA
ncbi:lysophospholipase L1-like esterase [Desulfosporosinus acidiphilus SJ4]|uniref:Lysophospholipase L1-like esterase n=1 Tax=Desulfosporosinus acidiphilus (strain DSM 22704 / JCM 16185 / SJ4) TaxID=646529 RepID=I4D108_DESAJ|nr:SGNH/GDSL hydrolase family protein [Desulfosporosinus acidiphilus]AFM39482.1 lysophospholipase L1-like esterase [Desulfosporosinus acidiphilus SJ4]